MQIFSTFPQLRHPDPLRIPVKLTRGITGGRMNSQTGRGVITIKITPRRGTAGRIGSFPLSTFSGKGWAVHGYSATLSIAVHGGNGRSDVSRDGGGVDRRRPGEKAGKPSAWLLPRSSLFFPVTKRRSCVPRAAHGPSPVALRRATRWRRPRWERRR